MFKDNELEKVIELYKNNSLVTQTEDYIKNSPKENFESTEKSTSTLIQAESIEQKIFILMKNTMKWNFNCIARFPLVRTSP